MPSFTIPEAKLEAIARNLGVSYEVVEAHFCSLVVWADALARVKAADLEEINRELKNAAIDALPGRNKRDQ